LGAVGGDGASHGSGVVVAARAPGHVGSSSSSDSVADAELGGYEQSAAAGTTEVLHGWMYSEEERIRADARAHARAHAVACAACAACPAGQLRAECSVDSASACAACPNGKHKRGSACEQCSPCDPGFRRADCAGFDAGRCVECEAGRAKLARGGWETACARCPAGKHQPVMGQTACVNTPAPTAAPTRGGEHQQRSLRRIGGVRLPSSAALSDAQKAVGRAAAAVQTSNASSLSVLARVWAGGCVCGGGGGRVRNRTSHIAQCNARVACEKVLKD
jgi:hypothetical protein